ncbi:MAG: hypothetical protein NTY23_07225 [Chloroflexi bacterium]|nr:hypothetical protein [Chloroflexota bacterium]
MHGPGEPGHFETDLVHHCSLSTSCQYVHTLQMIDVATGWSLLRGPWRSERVAVLGRSYLVMQDGFLRILARLPFPVLEIHPDNGGEFLNNHLLAFWKRQSPSPLLSRSRPWQKDTVDQTWVLNQLYDRMWWFPGLPRDIGTMCGLGGLQLLPTSHASGREDCSSS